MTLLPLSDTVFVIVVTKLLRGLSGFVTPDSSSRPLHQVRQLNEQDVLFDRAFT